MRLAGLSLSAGLALAACQPAVEQVELGTRHKPLLEVDGLSFRDLDADGQLAPYEDWRLSPEQRSDDLVARMTLPEKVGTLMHANMPGLGKDYGQPTGYDLETLGQQVNGKYITSYLTRLSLPPAEMAEQSNAAQEVAEASRLGIPLTFSTDPRNHFQYVLGASASVNGTTQWPELLGFAALDDEALVRRFGEIARKEYRAIGIHMALSPQLDLATEPRWPRVNATFGSDSTIASRLGGAYVAGFQGGEDGLQADGVITVAKHWVGYGAQPEGWDAHNYYGRFATPGEHLPMHIAAFDGALAAKTAGIMPAYPILLDTELDGEPLEPVGPGYSRQLLTGLLREELGFEGFILSDWALTRDCPEECRAPTADKPQTPPFIATSWGVDDLTVRQRYTKAMEAGINQFGGVDDVDPLIEAVTSGELAMERIDDSVRRIMIAKYQLGLFENPYVDPAEAVEVIGQEEDMALARQVQAEAQVLLQDRDGLLPLAAKMKKVWLFGMDPGMARKAGLTVVDTPDQADFAIVRAEAPSEMLHPHHFFGSRQKEGRLDFRPGDPAYDAVVEASEHAPVIFAIFLDRPAVLTGIAGKASVILGNFGASDAAVLSVITGKAHARGKLPFELPRSMDAVEAQDPALADDSKDPLFPFGYSAATETAD